MEAVFKSIIGISQYQFWYFGESGTKILQISNYLLNKQLMVYLIFFFLLIFYYLLKLIKNKIDIYGVLTMFVNLSTFLAFLIYSYGSGGWSYEALSLSITFTFFGLLFYFIESFIHRHGLGYIKKIGEIYISAILFMVFGLYWVKSGSLIIANNKIQRNAPYSENLGGYSSIAYDLDRAVNIIGNEQVFSTYAGALEIITGRYQPTGIDYIIYALGDNQREKYINNFLTNKYLYVTTIRNNHLAPGENGNCG
jgi:hypothetical protein